MITYETKQQIKQLAQETQSEIAGFVLENGNLYPCQNISTNPRKHFSINPIDYLKATYKSKIKIVYHSHNKSEEFSEYDKVNLYNHKLRGVVYCKEKDVFNYFIPESYKNQYVGRAFEIGVCDCFSIVKEYYKNELNIEFPEFQRKDGWYQKSPNIIIENIPSRLKRIDKDKIEKNDILLFDMLQNNKPCHMGIYMGNDLVLHHPRFRLSNIEVMMRLKEKIAFGLRL